ncbi:MAG: MBL fold metallo-hydrolase, partial [Firmicutes bacterium]|nr:MBL fold metallo-hydrolase [Bacillota bacterium]
GNGAFRFFMMQYEDEPFYREKGGQGMMMPLRDGDVLDLGGRPLKVIHIPGHTPGSVALLDENAGVLISGDSVQSDNIFLFGPRRNMKEFIRSLERLKGLKGSFSEVWPSHGAFPAQPDLIDKLIEGARQITDGKVTGTQTVWRDTPVMLYEFPYAGFICDI